MKDTTYQDIKNNPYVIEFIKQTNSSLKALGYTEHSFRHLETVALRAKKIAQSLNLTIREQEVCAIAAYCHDLGNFLSRTFHHYFAGLIFLSLFKEMFPPQELAVIMQAIMNHDKFEMKFTNAVSAILVLADKSDVHRSRVMRQPKKDIENDIHDRVNYATTKSELKVNKKQKKIILYLEIDAKSVPIMEYFEIFTQRMTFCRQAAEYLGYNFSLVINKFKLL